MNRQDRKAAISAWKERGSAAGIYALRSATTGAVWVGAAPDVRTIRNRILFTLRHGSHRARDLQAAWAGDGEAGLGFEVLEVMDPGEETPAPYVVTDWLKARAAHWRALLKAHPL